MATSDGDEGIQLFGASVRGPRNKREAKSNQDSCLRVRGAFGHLIVVCDGLGSRPASDLGARTACVAVRQAAGLWPGAGTAADPAHLVRLVEVLWRLRLAPRTPAECATTCMFALRESGGHLVLAGLGDGLAALRKSDRSVTTYGGRRGGDFGNETRALGAPHRVEDWWIATDPPGSGRAVVLTSDGVADDLEPARVGGFIEWLVGEIGQLRASVRTRRLRRELESWPVPHHVDDKTVAVLAEMDEVVS